jgi:hypothetical protein
MRQAPPSILKRPTANRGQEQEPTTDIETNHSPHLLLDISDLFILTQDPKQKLKFSPTQTLKKLCDSVDLLYNTGHANKLAVTVSFIIQSSYKVRNVITLTSENGTTYNYKIEQFLTWFSDHFLQKLPNVQKNCITYETSEAGIKEFKRKTKYIIMPEPTNLFVLTSNSTLSEHIKTWGGNCLARTSLNTFPSSPHNRKPSLNDSGYDENEPNDSNQLIITDNPTIYFNDLANTVLKIPPKRSTVYLYGSFFKPSRRDSTLAYETEDLFIEKGGKPHNESLECHF